MNDKNAENIEQIKYLISKGKELDALNVLNSVVANTDNDQIKNDFILIENQLQQIKKREYLGIVSNNNKGEKNDLIYRLLQLIDSLKLEPQALHHIEERREEIENAKEEIIFSIRKKNKKILIYFSLGLVSVILIFVGVPVLLIFLLIIAIILLAENGIESIYE